MVSADLTPLKQWRLNPHSPTHRSIKFRDHPDHCCKSIENKGVPCWCPFEISVPMLNWYTVSSQDTHNFQTWNHHINYVRLHWRHWASSLIHIGTSKMLGYVNSMTWQKWRTTNIAEGQGWVLWLVAANPIWRRRIPSRRDLASITKDLEPTKAQARRIYGICRDQGCVIILERSSNYGSLRCWELIFYAVHRLRKDKLDLDGILNHRRYHPQWSRCLSLWASSQGVPCWFTQSASKWLLSDTNTVYQSSYWIPSEIYVVTRRGQENSGDSTISILLQYPHHTTRYLLVS